MKYQKTQRKKVPLSFESWKESIRIIEKMEQGVFSTMIPDALKEEKAQFFERINSYKL